MIEFIDAYMHCGLSKYKPLPEVEKAMGLANVDRAVLVQHLGEFDNTYIRDVVAGNPDKFAGVCLVDYRSKNAIKDLKRWVKTGKFRGVRFLLESLEINPVLWQEAVNLGLNIIVYDPDGIVGKLKLLMNFLEKNPTAVFVLSHLGVPNMNKDPELIQYQHIFQLSKYPQVYFQVSGMHMFFPYPYEKCLGIISKTLGYFGPDRMLWGGNYPVIGSDDDYAREVELVRSGKLGISGNLVIKVTCDTTYKLWFHEG